MHFASTETKRQIFSQSYVEKNSFEKNGGQIENIELNYIFRNALKSSEKKRGKTWIKIE